MDNSYLNAFLFYALGVKIFSERAGKSKEYRNGLLGVPPQWNANSIEKLLDCLMSETSKGDLMSETSIGDGKEERLLGNANRVLRILNWSPGKRGNENDFLPSMLSGLIPEKEAPGFIENEEYIMSLKRLSPQSIFPISNNETEQSVRGEYGALWEEFIKGEAKAEQVHCGNNSFQWLESLDKRLMEFMYCQPPAGEKANYSLYDQIKIAAALAACLSGPQSQQSEQPFLLIKANFWGIQEFIFSGNTHSNKAAAKVLRGRSLMVSLITECAALRILKDLNLPPACLLVSAAGQSLILAPNVDEIKTELKKIKKTFCDWSCEKTLGKSGVLLSWIEIEETDVSEFSTGFQKINQEQEIDKFRKFDLLNDSGEVEKKINHYFDSFGKSSRDNPVRIDPNELLCPINSDLAGQIGRNKGLYHQEDDKSDESNSELKNLSYLSFDQVLAGQSITFDSRNFIAFSRYIPDKHLNTGEFNSTPYKDQGKLINDYFGFQIRFFDENGLNEIKNDDLQLLIKLYEPGQEVDLSWIPTRFWKGTVPRYEEGDIERFKQSDLNDRGDKIPVPKKGMIKALPHLAEENIRKGAGEEETSKGIRCLIATKGDVDNLGKIFKSQAEKTNPAAYLCLSRSIDLFFSYYLPSLGNLANSKKEENFPNTYTVFAGGDDFFLIGPQREQMALIKKLKEEFSRYTGNNKGVTFSAGLFMSNPFPNIYVLAKNAERFLEAAKKYQPTKNAVSVYGISMTWDEYNKLDSVKSKLDEYVSPLSQGFLYKILEFIEMAESEKKDGSNIRNSLWYSQLAYTLAKMNFKSKESAPNNNVEEFNRNEIHNFFIKSIKEFSGKFKILIYNHLYEKRTHQPTTEKGEDHECRKNKGGIRKS